MKLNACRGWLEAELRLVKPIVLVCLGATAAQAFLGSGVRLTQHLGDLLPDTPFAPWWMATYHPSALLRMPDEVLRHEARQRFHSNLAQLVPLLVTRQTLRRRESPGAEPRL